MIRDSIFGQGRRVRIKDSVLRKVRMAAEISGCTVEEFIQVTLEREAQKALALKARLAPPTTDEDVAVSAG